MKIIKFGTVTLTEGPVNIEGWNIQREPNDPKDATDEQLLLGFAITWAQERLTVAVNSAILDVFRDAAKKKKLDAYLEDIKNGKTLQGGTAPFEIPKPSCLKHSEQKMILNFYDRPGGPPGNGWVCPSCMNERSERN
jgi:hypothetical protein